MRKWARVVPDGARLLVPQWVPLVAQPTQELQESTGGGAKKAASSRKKVKVEAPKVERPVGVSARAGGYKKKPPAVTVVATAAAATAAMTQFTR